MWLSSSRLLPGSLEHVAFSCSHYTEWFLNLLCNKQKSPSQYGNVSFLRGLYSNVVLKQIRLGSINPDMGPSPWLLGTGPSRWGSGQSGYVGGRGQNIDVAVCGVPVQS